jgi:deoxyribonuclease-4
MIRPDGVERLYNGLRPGIQSLSSLTGVAADRHNNRSETLIDDSKGSELSETPDLPAAGSMRLGPHIDPPLAEIPPVLAARGWIAFQTTLRDPRRLAKQGIPDEDDQAAYRARSAGLWGIAHASMLTNLGSTDPRTRNSSMTALAGDANLAASLGLAGVCFHVGYEKGHDSRDAALTEVARKLTQTLGKLKPGARVLLENGCEGSELGQTAAEIGTVIERTEGPKEQLGVVLDTCHLHVSGFDLAAPGAADRLAEEIEAAGVAPYLTAFHMNDAREPCGSHRDRHAVPGTGTIGEGMARLAHHPFFARFPGILEMGLESAERGIAFLRNG